MNGKKSHLTRKDFITFAQNGRDEEIISEKVANRLIDQLLSKKAVFLNEIDHSYLCEDYKKGF